MTTAFGSRMVAVFLLAVFLLAVSVCVAPTSVNAASKLALILQGADAPQDGPDLKSALKESGFSVLSPGVANSDGISWALEIFNRKLSRLGPGAEGLVYVRTFSTAYRGAHYLLPSLAKVGGQEDAPEHGFPLNNLLQTLAADKPGDIGIVLDICHPSDVADGTDPIAHAPLQAGLFVKACAADEEDAQDPVFVSDLFVNAISTPGLSIQQAFAQMGESETILSNVVAETPAHLRPASTTETEKPDPGKTTTQGQTKPQLAKQSASVQQAPKKKSRRHAGKITGTGATGWGGGYLSSCGSDIQYTVELTEKRGFWSATLVHGKSGEVIKFKQRDKPGKNGDILLYGRYSPGTVIYTAIVRTLPNPGGKLTFGIPNAGVGSCAVGYLD